jgi:hypothetical protein
LALRAGAGPHTARSGQTCLLGVPDRSPLFLRDKNTCLIDCSIVCRRIVPPEMECCRFRSRVPPRSSNCWASPKLDFTRFSGNVFHINGLPHTHYFA